MTLAKELSLVFVYGKNRKKYGVSDNCIRKWINNYK